MQQSVWPELDELKQELERVCELPRTGDEPLLTTASLAVTQATTALTRTAQLRGREAEQARAAALSAVEKARLALSQARTAILAAENRRQQVQRRGGTPPTEDSDKPGLAGHVEATCTACGRPFVVRYRYAKADATTVFPVSCPEPACDGTANVEYPTTAFQVEASPR